MQRSYWEYSGFNGETQMKENIRFRDIGYWAAAAITVNLLTATSAIADPPAPPSGGAAGGIGTVAGTLTGQFAAVGKLIVGGAFIVGIFLVGTGLSKLKQAVDTQGQQAKVGDGLARLAIGAALVALPAVTGVGMKTFGFQDAGTVSVTDGGLN
jgi:hypothetical protein